MISLENERAIAVLLVAFFLAAGVRAKGQFEVVHSPSSLKWIPQTSVTEAILKDIYTASLGATIETGLDWGGISIEDPFNLPKAVVEVLIDGVANLSDADTGHVVRYPVLEQNEQQHNTFAEMCKIILSNPLLGANGAKNKLVHLTLSDEPNFAVNAAVLGEVKITENINVRSEYLNRSNQYNFEFLKEIDVLDQITKNILGNMELINYTHGDEINFYHLRFMSLRALHKLHGFDSNEMMEANKLLAEYLKRLSEAFSMAYRGRVLVAAVYSDAKPLTRRTVRSITIHTTDPAGNRVVVASYNRLDIEIENIHNTATIDDSLPTYFNICLWTCITLLLILLIAFYGLHNIHGTEKPVCPYQSEITEEVLNVIPEYMKEKRTPVQSSAVKRRVYNPANVRECLPTCGSNFGTDDENHNVPSTSTDYQ